jgi:hypothetical protein
MIEKDQIYRHYKGNCYIIRGIATDANSLKEMVVYESLLLQKLWVRALSEFEEKVFTFKPGEGLEPRFKLVEKDKELEDLTNILKISKPIPPSMPSDAGTRKVKENQTHGEK